MLLAIENPLTQSALAFPALEVFHIIGFAAAIGTIALVDLRMSGLGLLSRSAFQLQRDTGEWTIVGLVVAIVSGLLLFSTDPDMYYLNLSFVLKMLCLLVAIIWQYTIHRKVAMSKDSQRHVQADPNLLSADRCSVIFSGIFIGFVDSASASEVSVTIVPYLLQIQSTSFFSVIRESAYAYPILLSLHLSGIALSAGMVLVTDLRLMGASFGLSGR